jgi:hypothetical protein
MSVCISHHSHAFYMSAHLFLLGADHFNNISFRIQAVKVVTEQLSAASCYVFPVSSKCLPQRPVLKHTECCCITIGNQISHPYRSNKILFSGIFTDDRHMNHPPFLAHGPHQMQAECSSFAHTKYRMFNCRRSW